MFAKCWPLYYIDNRKWKHENMPPHVEADEDIR